MAGQKSIDRDERLIASLPAEFRAVADWAWNRVGAETARECARLGMDPLTARETAARVAALVAKNVYSSVTWYRRSKQLGVRPISALLLALAPAIAAAQPAPASAAAPFTLETCSSMVAESLLVTGGLALAAFIAGIAVWWICGPRRER